MKSLNSLLSKLFNKVIYSFNDLDLPTVLIKDLHEYKNRPWENITANLHGLKNSSQSIPNNLNLIQNNLEAYSDYFNYGFNPFTWRYKVEEFKEKIREIRKKLTEEEFARDFINEYNLDENNNEKFYLSNLPLELGGIGDYLKNTYHLNFFNTNKRGIENIPPIEYNKFNSHYVNLPCLEKGTIDKREKEETSYTKQEIIGDKDCNAISPVSVSMKDKLNNTNIYLKNNNSFNMKHDTKFNYPYGTLPYNSENKTGKFGRLDRDNNPKEKKEQSELIETKNDNTSENSISSSESRNKKKDKVKHDNTSTKRHDDKEYKNKHSSRHKSPTHLDKYRNREDKYHRYREDKYKQSSKGNLK